MDEAAQGESPLRILEHPAKVLPHRRLILKSADYTTDGIMKTFGTILSEARKAKGFSQKELAARLKKEDGSTISPQYLNDIEHDRRNPPSEFLISQIAALLDYDRDALCFAAGTFPNDLMKLAAQRPEKAQEAVQLFRRSLSKDKK
jgi:transcriptional regulator with XRE-family HTH domain